MVPIIFAPKKLKASNMKKLPLIACLFALSLLSLLSACKKGEEVKLNTFDAVVENGGGFAEPETEEVVLSSESNEVEIDGETWICTTETKSVKRGGGGTEGFPLFNPNANVIYPGNMLQGKSLKNATPDIIAVERAGGTISTDVVDGNIQSTFSVGSVTKSEVTNAINNIIAGSTGIVPANFEFSYANVQSREQFALEVGVDVSTAFTDLEAKLSFSTNQEYNRYFVSLNQSYYTMSFDIPTSLDQLFAEGVTPEDLAKYVGEGNPATYISDVTYGRIYYMLIESTSSMQEMDAAIAASFNGVVTDVDGSIEASYLSELDELKIQVFAFGGEASSTLQTIGETNLNVLVDLLAESADIGSGKPLSYTVRSVYDNQIVSVQLATQYDVTNCVPSGNQGAPPYTAHWTGLGSSFGPIGAAFNTTGTEFILINKLGNQFMRSNVGVLEGPFSIDELGTEPCPFSGIGAACNIDGNQNGEFYLMAIDATGTQYTYMNPSGKWSTSNVLPISNLAGGTCPFNLTGIGAMAFRHVDPLGPSSRYMFNMQGDKYTYYLNNPQSFDSVYNLWQWGPDYSCPFDRIGAAIGFYIGDDLFFILFDHTGFKYTIYGNVNGAGYGQFLGSFTI